jgi:hypothetical protein
MENKTWAIIGAILCGMMVFVFILMIGDFFG